LVDVKASKLMATKYPGLIPVYDQKVSWLLSPMDTKAMVETDERVSNSVEADT
jgi:hypothetical protein